MDEPKDRARRSFAETERRALWEAYEGRCANCRVTLDDGWEADHAQPFARGGPTDVLNGQPLCRSCNRRKGDRWMPDLRQWQSDALDLIRSHDDVNFLCVATPGAGKTTFANAVALEFLRITRVRRIVVICPSEHLKTQWAGAASQVGIELDSTWAGGPLASDYRGVVVTYQAVASNPHAIRLLTKEPTLAIVDEIHHAADEKSWGDNLKYALGSAAFRLALSGTPFRSDNHAIPFVQYVNGRSFADYKYEYGQALDDDICRPVFFPRWDGRMEWMRGPDVVTATFSDELDDQASRERLRTAITSEQWLRDVLGAADRQLGEIRAEGHPQAGALVIATDQNHARRTAGLIRKATGQAPVVAISDDPDASNKISSFARGTEPWLVAVRMVSEGVDIPRLRVCVFATNIGSRLFFRQAVGRLVRVIPSLDEQNAYFYIPDDPLLRRHALEIKQEREHVLRAEIDRLLDEIQQEREQEGQEQSQLYAPISAEASEAGAVFNEELIEVSELSYARQVAHRAGLRPKTNENLYPIAAVLRAASLGPVSAAAATAAVAAPPEPSSEPATVTPLVKRKQALRKLNSKAVGHLAALTGAEHKTLNWEINQAVGIKEVKSATADQLVARLELLRKRIEEAS